MREKEKENDSRVNQNLNLTYWIVFSLDVLRDDLSPW